MLTFEYIARDPATGQKVKAQVRAENEQAAAKLIKKEGLAPIEIKVAEQETKGLNKILHRIKTKDKVLFSRQLSTLIGAGLPLVQSLRNVANQTQNKKFRIIINSVITDVEAGTAFSVALGRHPEVFDNVFVNLVAAGEASGTLDTALERIANQQEKDADLIRKVRGAMVYPAIVVLVMIGVVSFMVLRVLPQVEEIYKELPGANLPILTRILLAVSSFTRKYWWIELIVLGLVLFFTTRWARTAGGKEVIDKLKLRLPLFGTLFTKMYMSRFARVGATLVGSGVPLIQMLEIDAKAVNNVHVSRSIMKAAEKVKGGKALSDSLQGDPNFLELVPDMLRIGEQSGAIEKMLSKTADYYEKEVDNAIKNISTTIEPMLMVLLGVVAFIIVAAVLLPIYGLAGKDFIN